MTADITHRAFFGDREYEFRVAIELIPELERTSGTGIGGLCRRLFAGEFRHADITETIRLALIGGGTSPEHAAALVTTYVAGRPLGETYPLAVAILETLWFGAAKAEEASEAVDGDRVQPIAPDDLQSIAREKEGAADDA